ncbi:hypothetical protein [Methanolobus vulcani]|uniref:EF-hand domain-containing protein n=1 Tax=Methanolobus vulcani TaxID=38026 RepID=A0A7Z8KLI0_9EURY|nr:hypothetical protein [Methanolobus vulcani]TQD23475.1 hypothetical protein FKV42_13185 [Methanolobus vulcani]
MKMKIQRGLLLVAVALVTICMIAATASAEDDVNSLRIYGEDGLSAAFPYTDPEAPFDPMNNESPVKDFVTFNPAVLENTDIFVNNIDSKQKVFATQWFVPEYTEPTGMVWLDKFDRCFERTLDDGSVEDASELLTDDELREISFDEFQKPILKVEWIPDHNEYTWEDVVTEFTYMFVDKHYEPVSATSKSSTGAYWTSFLFPVADNDDEQIGLDDYDMNGDGVDDMVVLKKVGDFNRDGYKDVMISSDSMVVSVGDQVQFLDHIVEVEGIYYTDGKIDRVGLKVYYNGNNENTTYLDHLSGEVLDTPEHVLGPQQIGGVQMINIEQGILSAGRHTVTKDRPQFYEPWYVQVEAAGAGLDKVVLTVGRQLYTRETFFVDGAEYDVAMIYGPDDSWYNGDVKYITLRNPVPEHADVFLEDLSVIKRCVYDEEIIPLLPPFNMEHTMIDDINIPHTEYCCDVTGYIGHDSSTYEDECIDSSYDTVKERRIFNVEPLEIYFINKDDESRFHTDLYEILDESDIYDEGWKWLHIRTMPEFYKEFVYPELPDIDDGTGDFLVTSSFTAPNSELCDDWEAYVCNPENYIIPPQRLMFTYDQETGADDIYVNEIDDDTNGLRVYGEGDMDAEFPYSADNPEGPFDPLNPEAPEKDFVTINPALIKAAIVVDNEDSYEKVFFRQWFVPEYTEPTGMVWLDDVFGKWVPNHNEYVWEDVVNEFSYMFIDKHCQPISGIATPDGNPSCFWDLMNLDDPLWTYFWFPVADDDTQIGLDSMDMNGDGIDDPTYLFAATDFNNDGRKDVALGSEEFVVGVGDTVQFLDHIVEVEGIYYADGKIDRVAVKVYYNGNDENPTYLDHLSGEVLDTPEHVLGPQQIGGVQMINVEQGILSAGRHTVTMDIPDFYNPWAMQVTGTGVANDKVVLRVGRLLHTGETFFVDGAEYDVSMIYGPGDYDVKYITIRNPVPEHRDVFLEDLSVIKRCVYDEEIIPVLPPFNGPYMMIDDIDLVHSSSNEDKTCYYSDFTAACDRTLDAPALEIYFTGKDDEPRFHTNLLEILRECCGIVGVSSDTVIDDCETWKWLHISTMPEFYKEFVYPDVPDYDGNSGDYLLTSSFTAPNTDACDDSLEPVRLMFTYDPTDGTGLYMNGGVPAIDDPDEPVVDQRKGDGDGDEDIDLDDFRAFADAYGTEEGDSYYDVIFDMDDDGDIDLDDFRAFADVYNT